MSIAGIFATAVSGVAANSTSLQVVSDNIANSQTVGFKRGRTDFSQLVTAAATSGGIEAGGVAANTRQMVTEQGVVARTSSQTDLALLGDGFFVVSNTATNDPATDPFVFTRAGSFAAQADGALVNDAGFYLRGARIDNGAVPTGNLSLNSLETVNINRIPTLAAATTILTIEGNLSANAAAAETVTQSFQIYDTNGAESNLTLTLTALGGGEWRADAATVGDAPQALGGGTLRFGADGLFDPSSSDFPSTLQLANGQSIELNLGSLSFSDRPTGISTASADGAPSGALTGVEVSDSGLVTALYANGLRRDIYQLAIATFFNPEGLEDGPSSTFLNTSAAGEINLGIPGMGRVGALQSASLEVSTVDIGQEFSTLIETQRAYSANSKVITIADELWRTLTQTAR